MAKNKEFISKINKFVTNSNMGMRAVFIIREDFLGQLAKYRFHVPSLMSSVFAVKELSRLSANNVIRFSLEAFLIINFDPFDNMTNNILLKL